MLPFLFLSPLQNSTSTGTITLTVPPITLQMLYVILPTLLYAVGSYLQNTPQEKFDLAQFLKTILIAVLVGYFQFTNGITYDQAFQLVTENFVYMFFVNKAVDSALDWLRTHKGLSFQINIGTSDPVATKK